MIASVAAALRRVVRREHLGRDRARRHRVDGDAVPGQLERPGARQAHDAGLGRGIAAAALLAQGGLAGEVDDPAPAAGAHAGEAGLGHGDRRQDIDRELAQQGFGRDVASRCIWAMPRLLTSASTSPRALIAAARATAAGSARSTAWNSPGKGTSPAIPRDPDHAMAVPCQQLRRGQPDASAGAGDQDRARRHAARPSPPGSPASRPHPAGGAAARSAGSGCGPRRAASPPAPSGTRARPDGCRA